MPVDVTLEMNILPYLRTMQLIDVGDFVKNSSSMVSAKYHFVFNFDYWSVNCLWKIDGS